MLYRPKSLQEKNTTISNNTMKETMSKSSTNDLLLPPNGNWQKILWIMFISQIISLIGFSSVFPFLPLYVHSLGTVTGLSESLCAALVYSGHAFTMMLLSPLWGSLADRYGRKLMVERAMFSGAVIVVLMAFARSAEELVLLRVLQGAMSGVLGAANALVAASAPRERSGYAMGLMQVAMGIGLALGPVIGGILADLFNYQSVFFVTSALLLFAGIMVWFGIDEHFIQPKKETGKRTNIVQAWIKVLQTEGVGLLYLLRFINQAGRMMFMPILPLFILSLIKNPDQVNSYTGMVIGLASLATAIFSVFIGRLGDRTSHRPIVIVSLFGAGAAYILQSFAQNGFQFLIFQILYGIGLGGVITAISALLAIYSEKGAEGTVYGLDSSVTSAARVIAPLVCLGVSTLFGLRMVFAVAGALYLIAAILALSFLPRK